MCGVGRFLIVAGIFAIFIGLILMGVSCLKIPFPFGRLKGDFFLQKNGFSFYFPLATGIVISIVLTLFFYLFSKR
ncbi:MAG: DUF2905 domain-containing protein [Candidatus Omnitrophica bacterium]|nr:DUF2905 domain-containing protein [Candidatus Omnitrophota bacterium]MDD5430522.1 DUF2905 domain-containing protein [Candidatus Omnitrophota bacterium]